MVCAMLATLTVAGVQAEVNWSDNVYRVLSAAFTEAANATTDSDLQVCGCTVCAWARVPL